MSFLAAMANKSKSTPIEIEKQEVLQNKDLNQLSKEEIKLILEVMKNSTFKGELVELLHSTIVKLQNQYLNEQEN